MQALDLHVKDGVGVERHALRLFDVGGKVELVGALDLVQPREHRAIAGEMCIRDSCGRCCAACA